MKKLFFLAAIITTVLFSSCSDNDTAGNDPQVDPTPQVDSDSWTVMFYSVGGGTLDSDQVGNMAEAFMATPNDNVNMTFQFKFSKDKAPAYSNVQGAFRFDMNTNRSKVEIKDSSKNDPSWMQDLTTEAVQDQDMSTAYSLAEFIAWSKKLHPAKHYMLILSDHGAGFDMDSDSAQAVTRSILQDDANDYKQLSLDNTVVGIKSGMDGTKLDAIYTDACLMATAENLDAYADVSQAFMGAEELTPGAGGDYTLLLNDLAANTTDFKAAAKAYIDAIVGERWKNEGCADLGYYDLTKMQTLIAPMKSLSDAIKATYDSGDATAQEKLYNVIATAQISYNNYYAGTKLNQEDFGAVAGGAAIGTHDTGGEIKVTVGDCQEYLNQSNEIRTAIMGNPTSADDPLPENICNMLDGCGLYGNHQVTAAYFMKLLSESLGGDFTTIYNNYIAALKDATYLRNTKDQDENFNAYDNTSMAVSVFNMTADGIAQGQNNRTIGNFCTYETDPSTGKLVITGFKPVNVSQFYESGYTEQDMQTKSQALQDIYNRTKFAQDTNWGNQVLMLNGIPNPGLFSNPSMDQRVPQQ